jgi:pimeloyl-ACP methyl ester carboxylesterase
MSGPADGGVARGVGLRALVVVVLGALVALAVPAVGQAHTEPYPVEARYQRAGPSPVRTTTLNDRSGSYRVFYPADLGDTRHPVVTWGNGTDATPEKYPGLLNHLASWGYVVVASTSGKTGSGEQILAGARSLLRRDRDPDSVFHGRLDASRVAAAGHSQGAAGAINAAIRSDGLIRTVVPVSLPSNLDLALVSPSRFDVAALRTSVFYLGGARDLVLAPPAVERIHYDRTHGPAALAVLKDADHVTIQGDGGGFLGYLTAWLQFRLRADPEAARAFTGDAPELDGNSHWLLQAHKNLGPDPR